MCSNVQSALKETKNPAKNMLHVSHSTTEYISGWKTAADWFAIRQTLVVGQVHGWQGVFADFFRERLKLRYLEPIAALQASGESRGEGFSIVAIQCSLIEFLESAAQGLNYRYITRGQQLGPHEYSASRDIFVSFLSKRAPFSETFNVATAEDFYASVRCGLLHEARTKNGWRIWAADASGAVADTSRKIIFRDNFQTGLLTYLHAYESQLQHDATLQQAFIRKLNHLCQ